MASYPPIIDGMEISEEEYLIREPQAEYKSELRHGRIVAMSGATLAHSLVTFNLITEIGTQLKGRACTGFTSDTRIKVAAAHFYTYPDMTIVCGKPQLDAKDPCALLNPTVIFEVLSPSTEAYDRGEKFEYYKKLESLREYILVSQDKTRVEQFIREGNQWVSHELTQPDDVLVIEAAACRVPLREIYDKVD